MTIGANPAARAVAHRLGAVHRARHTGLAQGTLSAHLTVEQQVLDPLLDGGDGALQTLIAETAPQRIRRDHDALENLIKGLKTTGVPRRPQPQPIHERQVPVLAAIACVVSPSAETRRAPMDVSRSP